MKNLKLFPLLFILFASTITKAQTDAEKIVQKNLEAYNSLQLEEFMSCFSEEIELYNFGDIEVQAQGKEAIKNIFSSFFEASPKLHSKILKRIAFDNKVIDHEYITGANGRSEAFEIVMIYEVDNGKIIKMTTIRKTSQKN